MSPTAIRARTVQHVPPGEAAQGVQAGDFVLTHNPDWSGRLVRYGQALRFRDEERKYAYWNHCALIIDGGGTLVEARPGGVRWAILSAYQPLQYTLVRIQAEPADRLQIANYARAQVGRRYGNLTLASLALTLLTGATIDVGVDGELICSGLVASALQRGDYVFEREASHMMPADLAKAFKVEPPPDWRLWLARP